jgi:hypothetical protein
MIVTRRFLIRTFGAIAVALVAVVTLYVAAQLILASLPYWSLIYCAEGSFEELPTDDQALINAIKAMDERVRDDRVDVQRCQVDGALRITYAMTGNLWNRPGLEDLDRLCAELGYKRPRTRFMSADVTDNSWHARHAHRDPENQLNAAGASLHQEQ